ncbi:MAG: hypothetical protein U0514_03275 [Candidatus Andersenbacteria bacterium]
MSIAGRHSVANAVARTPLHTLPAQPARRPGAADRARRWMFAAAVALVLAGSFGVGGFVQQQKAKALIPVTDIFCVTCYLNRLLDEADQITVDQVRKIVIKEITKKVIEKIIYGNNGGVGIGGARSRVWQRGCGVHRRLRAVPVHRLRGRHASVRRPSLRPLLPELRLILRSEDERKKPLPTRTSRLCRRTASGQHQFSSAQIPTRSISCKNRCSPAARRCPLQSC